MGTQFWLEATLNSVIIMLGVCILSTILALPAAWFIERSDLPGARLLGRLFALPYVIPSYLLAISWIILANPSVGLLNVLAEGAGASSALFNIYHLGGIIFVESTALFALVFLSLRAALRRLDPSLEEAARIAGLSPLKVVLKVSLPLLWPTLQAALISTALASLASFGVPAMIGGPARVQVLTTGIYALMKSGDPEAFNQSLMISLELALFAIFMLLTLRFINRRSETVATGREARAALMKLDSTTKFASSVLLWLLWGVITALPLSVLVLSSFSPGSGLLSGQGFTTRAWHYVFFELPNFKQAAMNSLIISFVTAFGIALMSLLVALLRWKESNGAAPSKLPRWGTLLENLALFFYSLPGSVIAIFLILVALKAEWLGLSDTLLILILACGLKYFSIGLKVMAPATGFVHPSLVEAARLAGANVFVRLQRVWFPMLKAALLAAFTLVLMPCLAELTMSLLLYGPGTETLGVQLFQLQEYADRPSAAVVGTLFLAGVLGLQMLSERLYKDA